MMTDCQEMIVHLPRPTAKQREIIRHPAKRKIVRAGRRSGKTVGAGIIAVQKFLDGHRVLYAAPTTEQIERFWTTVTRALVHPIDEEILYKNETEHVIEMPRTETRIKAKTAWNADTLRGDYADFLILDEWQLMNEDAWRSVGAPMMLDHNGDAMFIYTPPSLHSRSVSKAKDKLHAAKMFARATQDETGRWKAFHFTSHDNPHISKSALVDITRDMTSLSYRMEIMAEDVTEAPGALWKRENILHVSKAPELSRIVVGLDPSATSEGDEAGIVVAGVNGEAGYVLADKSIQGSPLAWGTAAVMAYHTFNADRIIAEANQGGEMVSLVIAQVDPKVPVTLVHASRGKQTRAEPIAAQYEQGKIHHVGSFDQLEDELCLWTPGDASPNRMDACFVSGTMIETDEGPKAIEKVLVGERVSTRKGMKRVLHSGMTGENKTLTLMLSSGRILSCTPDHRIYVCGKGWTPAWMLEKGSLLLGVKSKPSAVDYSLLRNPKSNQYVPVSVLGKYDGKIEPVYNLEVENCPEYFANGIVVHNCVWALTELMLGDSASGLFFAGGN